MPELGPNTHIIPVRVDPTPYSDDPVDAGAYYYALGVFLVAWGRFEGHFVSTLVTLSALTWDSTEKHELPRAWGKRADYWRKAFKELAQLAPFLDEANALITDIILAARDRGILVHSMWGRFVQTEQLALEAISLKSEGDELAVGNIPVHLSTLQQMTLAANTLNSRLARISLFLGSVRPPAPATARNILRPLDDLKTSPPHARKGR
jgi:hypothetical protein